jgi:molecular chaperone GrpE
MTEDDATATERAADPESEEPATDGTAAEARDDAESPDDLVAEVAAHDEDLADEVAALRDRADDLEATVEERAAEIDDLTDRLKRTQADYQNYKKRAKRQQEEIRERATEDLVERLLDVRDNLARALDQDEDADIRDGVEATLRSFDRVLEEEDVEHIDPEPGAAVDPQRHEVMLRVESDQPADTVAEVYRPGYEMAGTVLQAAQVTVSEGPADGDGSHATEDDAE